MILAIDPGSVKTGVALVHEDGELKEKRIIPTQSLLQYVQECYDSGALKSVVMGDGTRHESLGNLVKSWIGEGHDEVSFSYVNENSRPSKDVNSIGSIHRVRGGESLCRHHGNIRLNR